MGEWLAVVLAQLVFLYMYIYLYINLYTSIYPAVGHSFIDLRIELRLKDIHTYVGSFQAEITVHAYILYICMYKPMYLRF